jgi:hypothetical protein
MQFLNFLSENVQGVAFNFDYKGYIISVSNCTAKGNLEIMVFNDAENIQERFNSVESAIIGIDKMILNKSGCNFAEFEKENYQSNVGVNQMSIETGQIYINTKIRPWLSPVLTIKSIDPCDKDYIVFKEKPDNSYHKQLLSDYYTPKN